MQPEGPTRRSPATVIDWSEIHRRLDRARRTLEQDREPTPEETRKVLQARAEQLAREYKDQAVAGENLEVLAFSLGAESYGIETRYIREVCPPKALTPLPCTPPFVLGITNRRGQMVSVIDLKHCFDLPRRGIADLDKLIIVQDAVMEFAILADAILGVRSIPLTALQSSLPTLTGSRDYFKGVTAERLVILDAGRLLADRKLIVHEEPWQGLDKGA